eukprot:scaffold1195_cov358-Prasinococcus_capsulatus_cf.AAC.8
MSARAFSSPAELPLERSLGSRHGMLAVSNCPSAASREAQRAVRPGAGARLERLRASPAQARPFVGRTRDGPRRLAQPPLLPHRSAPPAPPLLGPQRRGARDEQPLPRPPLTALTTMVMMILMEGPCRMGIIIIIIFLAGRDLRSATALWRFAERRGGRTGGAPLPPKGAEWGPDGAENGPEEGRFAPRGGGPPRAG